MRPALISLTLFAGLVPVLAKAQALPPNSAVPTTKVLAIGHIVGTSGPQAASVMPDEVRDTVNLYLAGKIDQWYVRQDQSGVVFLMNASGVAEATAMMSKLPLIVTHRMEFEYIPLGPLSPLRFLMTGGPASAAAKP